LRSMVQILQEKSQRRDFTQFVVFSILIVVALVVYAASNINTQEAGYWALGGLLCITIVIFVFLYYNASASRQLKLLKEDIIISKNQLEKVTNIASQIEDHTSQKLGTELKLQLRLVESEGAIRLAENEVGSPSISGNAQIKYESTYSELPSI